MLARARLTSHPSPILRIAADRDAMAWDAALLERELAVFRHERERIPSKQRFHHTPAHRLEIIQIMRLRDWSAPEEAWQGVDLPEPIAIRATDPDEIVMQVQRRSYRGDPALPIVTIRVDRKEAA